MKNLYCILRRYINKIIASFVYLCIFSLIIVWLLPAVSLARVATGSMEPAFGMNDLLLVTSVGNEYVHVGDVVVYRDKSGVYISHRVVQVLEGGVVTKGDANKSNDRLQTWSNVVGKVRLTLPYVGHVYSLLMNPLWLLPLVYAPAVGIIVGEIQRLRRFYWQKEIVFWSSHDSALLHRTI